MRIEVLIGSNDPIFYPISRPKILIGSADTCDVVLTNQGVSRKHIQVVSQDDKYYVIDQGSTNGSFINEERLVPGRRVEFTSFFPVRLGDDVLISLVSDEEEQVLDLSDPSIDLKALKEATNPSFKRPVSDSTTVINLSDLGHQQTERLVRNRTEKRSRLKQKKSKTEVKAKAKKRKGQANKFLAVLILGGAIFYQFYFNQPEEVVEEAPRKVGEVVEVRAQEVSQVRPQVTLMPVEDLTDRQSFKNYAYDIKCASDLEQALCGSMPHNLGVVQVGLMLNVMVDGSSFYEQAKKFVPAPETDTPEVTEKYEQELAQVAAALYLIWSVPSELNWQQLQDVKLTIALFRPDISVENPMIVIGILPEALKQFKAKIKVDAIHFIKKAGFEKAMSFTDNYYRHY